MTLEELVEELRGELTDNMNEVSSLRVERAGINERIRTLLAERKTLDRMVRATGNTKAKRRG